MSIDWSFELSKFILAVCVTIGVLVFTLLVVYLKRHYSPKTPSAPLQPKDTPTDTLYNENCSYTDKEPYEGWLVVNRQSRTTHRRYLSKRYKICNPIPAKIRKTPNTPTPVPRPEESLND